MPRQLELFPKTVYCIDTSSLINLIPPWKKDVYRRDVFPTIWEKTIIAADEKNVPNRIPSISVVFGVRCFGLLDFFKEIGIKY